MGTQVRSLRGTAVALVLLAVGAGAASAQNQNGSIVAWGRDDYGQCNVPSPNTDFVAVEKAETHHAAEGEKQAAHVRDKLLPAMAKARAASDTLEQLIPDDLWPLPRHSEMLFVR